MTASCRVVACWGSRRTATPTSTMPSTASAGAEGPGEHRPVAHARDEPAVRDPLTEHLAGHRPQCPLGEEVREAARRPAGEQHDLEEREAEVPRVAHVDEEEDHRADTPQHRLEHEDAPRSREDTALVVLRRVAVGPEHLDDRVQDLPRVEGADRADEDDEDCADDEVLELAELLALHLRHRHHDEGEHETTAMPIAFDPESPRPRATRTFHEGERCANQCWVARRHVTWTTVGPRHALGRWFAGRARRSGARRPAYDPRHA